MNRRTGRAPEKEADLGAILNDPPGLKLREPSFHDDLSARCATFTLTHFAVSKLDVASPHQPMLSEKIVRVDAYTARKLRRRKVAR